MTTKSLNNALWWSSGLFGLHRFNAKSWLGLIYLPLFLIACLCLFSPSNMVKMVSLPFFVVVGGLLLRDFILIQRSELKEKVCKQSKAMYFVLGIFAELIMTGVLVMLGATVIMALAYV